MVWVCNLGVVIIAFMHPTFRNSANDVDNVSMFLELHYFLFQSQIMEQQKAFLFLYYD